LRVVRTADPDRPREDGDCREIDAVFTRIAAPLCRLLGRDGYRALLERALDVAGEDYPLLTTVRPAIAPAGRLVGLPSVDIPSKREQVFEALAATLTVLLALLVQFLGPELVEQILCDDLVAGSSAVASRELSRDATA
jgi:hypothetical protein